MPSAILNRIEGGLLVQPTPIAFDFRDVPIAEAIRTINRQAGLRSGSSPRTTRPGPARLTLRTDEPLPFWKGIDALCEAGGLHYVLGGPAARSGRRDPAFPLYQG